MLADEGKLCGCLCLCSQQIRLSKEVPRMLKKVEVLLKAGSFPNGLVTVNYSPNTVEHIPVPSIEDYKTASTTLAKLMEALDNENFRRIGVLGMGGVGKTTLVKNLNNKLKSTCLLNPFSVVILATVSKVLDMKRVQTQIAERLNLEVKMEESMERIASRLYQRLEKEESFLLILDDVWEKIDLDCLGVPQPEVHKGSKIILTSRSSEVCREMMTDTEVKVDILNDEEAWQLFSQKAGEVASLEHITPYAAAVAKECCGLPLAIITVGTAMRRKTMAELWEHALQELRRSVPCIRGIKDKVFNPLKWSYDSLEGKKTKACFLYCALYPEDFSIDASELVQCWLAEGLIDEQKDFDGSINMNGLAVIDILKDSCLLEDGERKDTVKMHDVVRDVAIWIASSLEDECKSLVRSGIGLRKISESDLSSSLKRVSFMNNKIRKLPNWDMQCSEASTLLLQGNPQLEKVPELFLHAFQALKVLNVSGTRIQSLPRFLLNLFGLRALLLRNCCDLEELPPLGVLIRLQVLDLCATRIRELPKKMEKLTNLRRLDLSRTHYLRKFEAGIVSKWSSLEVLNMELSMYQWCTVGEGQVTFEELKCLKRLVSLSIRLRRLPHLNSSYLRWISRLRKFQFFIGEAENSLPTIHEKRRVIISQLNVSGEWIAWFMINATSVVLNSCSGLKEMLQFLDSASALGSSERSVGAFVGLKSLTITGSDCALSPRSSTHVPNHDLLPMVYLIWRAFQNLLTILVPCFQS